MKWFTLWMGAATFTLLMLQLATGAKAERCPDGGIECSENSVEARNGLPQLGYLVVAVFDQIANVFGRYPTTAKATSTSTSTSTTTTTTKPAM